MDIKLSHLLTARCVLNFFLLKKQYLGVLLSASIIVGCSGSYEYVYDHDPDTDDMDFIEYGMSSNEVAKTLSHTGKPLFIFLIRRKNIS